MGVFDFMNMLGNYEERAVARTEGKDEAGKDFIIDTCKVTDSRQPYETAVMHPAFNDNRWVIVELYDSAELAKHGHEKWVKTMQKPPKNLRDVSMATIAQFCDAFGPDDWRDMEEGE